MRLSEDQVRQGILHPDVDVRFACLHYFSESGGRNTTVMPVVIEALERFGRTKAFRFLHPIAELAQTPETIQWVAGELQQRPSGSEGEQDYVGVLSRLACHADPRLVEPHAAEIENAPGFSQTLASTLAFRLDLLAWDGPTLWNELERICEKGRNARDTGGIPFAAAKDIVEALARQGDQHADRMLSLLAVKIENFENNPMTWMEPLMVTLAGDLRHEPAIPLIIRKLHEDGDILNEECQTALVKIGTDACVEAIRADYPTAEWHFRLYASGALGRIRSDSAVQVGIELLKEEKNADLRDCLAQAIVEHFSFEGNEAARQVLLEDPDSFDLQCHLVSACTLMEQDFPELEGWRREIEERNRRKPFMFGGRAEQPPAPNPKKNVFEPAGLPRAQSLTAPLLAANGNVGRNDPCPCGSGKKYKKCCLNKGS